MASSPVPPVVAARVMWAAVLLGRPGLLLRLCPEAQGAERRRGSRVLRVLGVRHLLQAAGTAVLPTTPVRRVGAAADLLHALSAVLLAWRSGVWRRGAAIDSVVATGFAVATMPRRAPDQPAPRR